MLRKGDLRFDSEEKLHSIIVPSFPRNVQTAKINSRKFSVNAPKKFQTFEISVNCLANFSS
jgi:hypothetical protein